MHLCPICHSLCLCGGDCDDMEMTGCVPCIHFLRPECGADDEDWDEWDDDDWSESDGE